MSDKNFSWGIFGLIIMGITPVIAILVLALMGISDSAVTTALIGITTAAITGLSGVMNPNRKFNADVEVAEDIKEVRKMLQ